MSNNGNGKLRYGGGSYRYGGKDQRTIPIVGARPQGDKQAPVSAVRGGPRKRREFEGRADITLINMNLLYINVNGGIDQEVHPPLGLLYITSALEEAGHTVDFLDHQHFSMDNPGGDPFNLDHAMASFGELADVVGLSCMANLMPFTVMVAERIKKDYPDKIIVLGGVGPFGVEELIVERFPWVDIVARGEGEVTAVRLMEALPDKSKLAGVLGISYRAPDGKVVRNADQPRIPDLDTIPLPAYHRIDMTRYDAFNVITNRGCPFPCTFCSVAPIWNRRTSFRSYDKIIDEMRLLHEEYGVEQILFQDEFFYVNEKKIMNFSDQLIESGLKLTWKCFGRVSLVTEPAMRRMREAGCVQIRFGVESASDKVLDQVVKVFKFGDVIRVVNQAQEIFPSVETFFIWGFPFEDMEDFHITAIQMAQFRQMGITVLPSLLSFLPQTQIYNNWLAGMYPGELTLDPSLVPIYVVTGHEVLKDGNEVPKKYRHFYDLIGEHKDIFPGFLLYDAENNVRPKHEVLQQMGFA